MGSPQRPPFNFSEPGYFDMLNIKLRIGSLLFEIFLDRYFFPEHIGTIARHNHVVFEIQFVEAGTGTLCIGDKEIPLAAHSVHFIGPNVYHALKPSAEDPISRFYLQFIFKDTHQHDDFFPEMETRKIAETLMSVDHCQLADIDAVKFLVERIKAELVSMPLGYYSNIQSLFIQMIIHIVRSIRPESADYSASPKELDELRYRIIEYFFTRYSERLMLDELAKVLSLSTKQTNRIIYLYYGVSFKQKLAETRIEVAKDLLLNSDWPLNRIAEAVGYLQPHNFAKQFKKKTGLAPSEFQQRNR